MYTSGTAKERLIIAYDLDGHGLSAFSGRDKLSIADLAQDLLEVIDALGFEKVILLGHSMTGVGSVHEVLGINSKLALSKIIFSIFAQENPQRVEKIILLHPIRNMAPTGKDGMRKRAGLISTGLSGRSQVANTVSSTAVSKNTTDRKPTATAFIRHLVLNTNPEAYAAFCHAIVEAPVIHGRDMKCSLVIIGGEEDYISDPEALRQWASEVPNGMGSSITLKNVGHWGAIEDPEEVGKLLKQLLSPS